MWHWLLQVLPSVSESLLYIHVHQAGVFLNSLCYNSVNKAPKAQVESSFCVDCLSLSSKRVFSVVCML